MHEDFVRRRLLLHQGEQFSPRRIDAARAGPDVASACSRWCGWSPAGQLDAHGNLPDHHRRHRAASYTRSTLAVAYSTDLGVNVNAGWHHRNLFGNAEQLN